MGFRFASTAFAAGLSAALIIPATAASAQTAPLNPRVALKVGAIGAVSDAGIFIAQEKGYFRDEGLDVEIVGFKAAPQILPAIATGEVQVSGSAVTPALFNAFARGITMKLVADKGQVAQGFGFAAIVIRSDLADTVRDFKDLKGRKFAVMGKGVSSTTQLGKALERGGIEPNEVELIELGLPEMVAALGNKAIDGATLLEPFITFATARNVGIRWKGMEDFLPFTGQNGVIIYSQQFTQEQPEAAKRWMAAYLKGTRAYLDAVTKGTDRDGINAILAKHTAVKDLALLAKIAPTGFDPNGRMEIKSSRSRPGLVPQTRPAARSRRPRQGHRLSICGLCSGAARHALNARSRRLARSPAQSLLYKTLHRRHGRANTVPYLGARGYPA